MVAKNQELLNIMQQLEDEKPVGWGFKKNTPNDGKDDFSKYEDNIAQAIKKLELNQRKQQLLNIGQTL